MQATIFLTTMFAAVTPRGCLELSTSPKSQAPRTFLPGFSAHVFVVAVKITLFCLPQKLNMGADPVGVKLKGRRGISLVAGGLCNYDFDKFTWE